LATIVDKSGENGNLAEAVKRDFEVALRQLEQTEKLFKEQLEQLRQQLEYMKSSYPSNLFAEHSTENQLESPPTDDYQGEPPGQTGMSQLEEMLDSLRTEIAGELNKRDTVRADHDPDVRVSRSGKPEKGRKKKAEKPDEQGGPKVSKKASDIVMHDAQESDDPDRIQEEIFNMIREISQEKREQELKILATVEAKRVTSG
jgi:hypothetical protein